MEETYIDDNSIEYIESDDEVMFSDNSLPSKPSTSDHDSKSRYVFKRIEVLALLNVYKKHLDKFSSPGTSKEIVWEHLTKDLKDLGHDLATSQWRNKFVKLKAKYLKLKRDNELSSFEFAHHFKEILKHSPERREYNIYSNNRSPTIVYKKKIWTAQETQRLIINYYNFFNNYIEDKPPSNIWEPISLLMQNNNIQVTAMQCSTRWQNLIDYYENIVQNNSEKTKLFYRIKNAIKLGEEKSSKFQDIAREFDDEIGLTTESTISNFESKNNEEILEDDSNIKEEHLNEVLDEQPSNEDEHYVEYLKYETNDCVEENLNSDKKIPKLNNLFQEELLKYLHNKESSKQKRHEENIELKKLRIQLLEKILKKL